MTEQTAPAPRFSRIATIDLLRGLAMIDAILFHLWNFTNGPLNFPPSHGTLLAQLRDRLTEGNVLGALTSTGELVLRSGGNAVIAWFCMLSGLLLTLGALRSRDEVRTLDFYMRRPLRILTTYWAGIAIVVAFLALLAVPQVLIDEVDYLDAATRVGPLKYYDGGTLLASLLVIPRGFRIEWAFAIPSAFWFAFLLLQYYLLFPYLFRLAKRSQPVLLVAGAFAVSLTSAAAIMTAHQLGIISIAMLKVVMTVWSPFRGIDFALGVVLGFIIFDYGARVRRWSTGFVPTLLWIGVGVTIFMYGVTLLGSGDYMLILAYPIMSTGIACFSLPVLMKTPGRLESNWPALVLAWIGPMSFSVIIMNEPFRMVDQYLWFHGVTWSVGWWLFIIVLYVPGTLVCAALLSRALGLTPPEHLRQPLQWFRPKTTEPGRRETLVHATD